MPCCSATFSVHLSSPYGKKGDVEKKGTGVICVTFCSFQAFSGGQLDGEYARRRVVLQPFLSISHHHTASLD